MERPSGMLIFHAICYSKEAARTPFYSPLFSSLVQVSSSIAYRKLVWDLLNNIQVSVAFFWLKMPLGRVGALIKLVDCKFALRFSSQTGSIIFWGPCPGILQQIFFIGQYSSGGEGGLSAVDVHFFIGSQLSFLHACLSPENKQIDWAFIAVRHSL